MTLPHPLMDGIDCDAILFDCDGTLVDTASAHRAAFNFALSAHGVSIEPEFYGARFGLTPTRLLEELQEATGVSFQIEPVLRVYAARFQEDLSALQEIALVTDLARMASGVLPMAVASNGARANVRRTLQTVGLETLFDVIVTVEDVVNGKPAPDPYLRAAERLGVDPARCLVLEDTDEGLMAGRLAGAMVRDVRPFIGRVA